MRIEPREKQSLLAESALWDGLDVAAVRAEFPILSRWVRGHPLAYLDNAATTQKPASVIHAMERYYALSNANVHRGVHQLADEATRAFEDAREAVRRFLHASKPGEIVFVRGATEAINLVAHGLARQRWLREGDEILLSAMEHHANTVPWQRLRDDTGAALRVIPLLEDGSLDVDAYERMVNRKTRLVAVTHVSNVLGTINPIRRLVPPARAVGAQLLVDGAQAVQHLEVDVQELGCDYYVFSGHKMYGPMGVGALFGRAERLAELPPFQLGGDMIRSVTFERTTFADPPNRFEAGTPNVAGAVGLSAAIEFLLGVGLAPIRVHERSLTEHAWAQLTSIRGLRALGHAPERAGVISFVLDGVHAHDLATILDEAGVAVRAGHHCCQPLMASLGVPATVRASFAVYNTVEEIDRLAEAVESARRVFQ